MIAVGQKLPNATLYEFLNEETEGCAIGPTAFEIDKLVAGKKIVIAGGGDSAVDWAISLSAIEK